MAVSEIPLGRPFSELGVDSIVAAELIELVNVELNVNNNATLIFDHPTITLLADALSKNAYQQSATIPSLETDNKQTSERNKVSPVLSFQQALTQFKTEGLELVKESKYEE